MTQTFSKLLKLEAKQAYKTDPANMKQEGECAGVRAQVGEGVCQAPGTIERLLQAANN